MGYRAGERRQLFSQERQVNCLVILLMDWQMQVNDESKLSFQKVGKKGVERVTCSPPLTLSVCMSDAKPESGPYVGLATFDRKGSHLSDTPLPLERSHSSGDLGRGMAMH